MSAALLSPNPLLVNVAPGLALPELLKVLAFEVPEAGELAEHGKWTVTGGVLTGSLYTAHDPHAVLVACAERFGGKVAPEKGWPFPTSRGTRQVYALSIEFMDAPVTIRVAVPVEADAARAVVSS